MADSSSPRTVMIHPSINRPNQLLGGDRELVLITALADVSYSSAGCMASRIVFADKETFKWSLGSAA